MKLGGQEADQEPKSNYLFIHLQEARGIKEDAKCFGDANISGGGDPIHIHTQKNK